MATAGVAVCGIGGVMHSYDITAANVYDICYLEDVKWQYSDCMMLGDKGYLSAEVQQNLFDVARISLEVSYRLNQKNGVSQDGPTSGSASASRRSFLNSTTNS